MKLSHPCSLDKDCASGLLCDNCPILLKNERTCTRKRAYMPTSVRGDMHFNDYTWLVTHDSFCRVFAPNYSGVVRSHVLYTQEDNITNQLANGVRGLTIEMYHFKYSLKHDIGLCHGAFGTCYNTNAFVGLCKKKKNTSAKNASAT